MIWIAAIVSYIIAGAFNGAMDTLQFHYGKSVFLPQSAFWDPAVSWRNKYKNNDPAQGPKFPLSTTLLVGFTDGWHLMQMGYLAFQRLSIVLAVASFYTFSPDFWVNVGAWATIWVALIWVHAAGFHFTYSIILKK